VAAPDAARGADVAALIALEHLPDSRGRRLAMADATTGLAADAIATGDLTPLDELLTNAAEAAEAYGGWRAEVRLTWVRAEAALARGADSHGDEALAAARAAVAMSAGRSHRHFVKSRLIKGVAELAVGHRAEALGDLRVVTASPYLPLRWVVAAVLEGCRPPPRWAGAARVEGRRAVAVIAADLPDDLRGSFIESPAVRTLRGIAP
jgi:hypothetical protein